MHAAGATTTFWIDDPSPVEPLRLRRAPLLAAALAFAAGEALALHWQFAAILLIALGALLLLSLLAFRQSPRLAPLAVLALWAVAGCWCAQMQPSPPPQLELLSYADGLTRTVEAHVVRVRLLPPKPAAAPESRPFESGDWEPEGQTPTESIDLVLDRIEAVTPDTSTMHPITGGARVTVLDGLPTLRCGDTLELPLRLHPPDRYRDPGTWSYAEQLLSEGIATQASVKAGRIQITGSTARPFRCRAFAAQAWASARLSAFVASPANRLFPLASRLTPDDASMLNAMLFGDRAGLRHDLRLGFERTGSFHLFVVSGMHVALLAGMLFWALRRARVPRSLATLATIAVTAAYSALTGFGVPVQRALLMSSVFLLARWLGRNMSVLQALGAAALAVLAWDPRALTETSFQMTFLVLIAVGGLALPILDRTLLPHARALRDIDALWLDARLPPHLAQRRIMLRLFGDALSYSATSWLLQSRVPHSSRLHAMGGLPLRHLPTLTLRATFYLAELALVGLIIEACMALPMAVYFHRATPLALPANLLAIPLVGVLAPLAILTFCASLITPWLAAIPSAATALLLHAVTYGIAQLGHARFADTRIPAPAPAVITALLLALAYACWALRKRPRWVAATGLAALAFVPLATLWPEPPILHPGTLEVTALDVGQGDSLLVVSPDGHTLLVDAGGPVGHAETAAATADKWDIGEEVVAPFLWSRRLRRLDAVLLTHAHSDHMGGLPAILRDFHPRELWLSIDPASSADFQSLLTQAAALDIRTRHFHAGDTFPWGGTRATILSPEPGYANPKSPINDDSLVLRFDFGRASVLLEGDAERRSEDIMLANHRLAPVTLLKVGHHGSRTSTNPEFLTAIAPQQAVISSGRRNTFGHPRYEILERLAAAHIRTTRTDRAGATTFLLTPDGNLTRQTAAP